VLYDNSAEPNDLICGPDDDDYEAGYCATGKMVAFYTLIREGWACISVWDGHIPKSGSMSKYASTNLPVPTGEICIHQPEDPPVILAVRPGSYIVSMEQKQTDETWLDIDIGLFLEEAQM